MLAWHVWDVLGGTQAAFGDEKTAFVASDSCADCHSEIVEDWKLSSMSEAQTGTIMEAQLPITIGTARIEPGDWVVGDEDGVVVVPAGIAEEVLHAAEEKVGTENLVRDAVRGGMTPLEAFERYGAF